MRIASGLTDMGSQITRLNGSYMSSDFAAKVGQSPASLAVHKARLQATEASLVNLNIKRAHAIRLTGLPDIRKKVFRLMDLPEELRRVILEMVVIENIDDMVLARMPRNLPAIAAAGNEQLRQETILAVLGSFEVYANGAPKRSEDWLSTVNFGLLEQAGVTPVRDGFGAVRTAYLDSSEYGCPSIECEEAVHLVKRFENLRQLTVRSSAGIHIFYLGSDDISGEALGARVRGYGLGLPSFELPNLRKVTVNVTINTLCRQYWEENIACVPEWKSIIERGCQKLAVWLGEEYNKRGMSVTVDINADLNY